MRQEAVLLEARSAPLRQYLMDTVIPSLTKGLMEVATIKPKDPVDFLVRLCPCVSVCVEGGGGGRERGFSVSRHSRGPVQAEYLFKQALTEGE